MTAPWMAPMVVPRDATRTRPLPVTPTIGPAETPLERERRNPQGRRGVVPAVLRSAEQSPNTLLGMLNETLNPIRAGAQARELVEDAARFLGRGDAGGALMSAALAAMAIPGVPGPDDAVRAAKMIDVDGVMRPMLNSRGQLIHPDEEGIRNFWRWATEGGRNPVMDDAGNPLSLFHGTQSNVEQFDLSRVRERFPYSIGVHTTDRPLEASAYADFYPENIHNQWDASKKWAMYPQEGGNVMPLYMRTRNSLGIDAGEQAASTKVDLDRAQIIHDLVGARESGTPYDAVIASRKVGDEWDGINAIAFDPLDYKSAIGNSGAFSRTDPRLAYGLLGMLGLNAANGREP